MLTLIMLMMEWKFKYLLNYFISKTNDQQEQKMKEETRKYIEIMKALEPSFFKAGELACEMQEKSQESRKNDGTHEISIVTDADLAVQEYILEAMLQTDLRKCHVIAEEDTPCVPKFTNELDLFITLDPIDGTSNYAAGRPYYALIIALRTNNEILYTFCHWPKLNWTHIMNGNSYKSIGEPPKDLNLPEATSRSIVYSFGDYLIEEKDPVATVIEEKGLQVISRKELSPEIFIGSTALFLGGFSAGYYAPNPLCVDGLVCFHYAQTQNLPVYSKGPNGKLDFSLITDRATGNYHPGYYIVLR